MKDITEKMNNEMIEKYLDCYKCLYEAWKKANNTFSWSGLIGPSYSYTKATKEYMNAIIAEYLFIKFHATKGWHLSEYRLKCHVIQRILRKGELWDISPFAKEYLKKQGMEDGATDRFLFETIKQTFPQAYDYVEGIFSVSLTEEEETLFTVAKNLATYFEFEAIKDSMTSINREEKQKEIDESIRKIDFDEYLETEEMDLLLKLTDAVRLVRWAKYSKGFCFTDAAHMLLTALLAEITTIEYQELGLVDETIDPTRAFFKALLHDGVEVRTGDAPSPCKDKMFFKGVGKKLRKIFEEFEDYVYKKFFFKPMDPLLQEEFKEKVVFDEGDDPISKIVKNCDYFSADIECYLMIVIGVSDKNYFNILKESFEKATRNKEAGFCNLRVKTPAATELLKFMYEFSKTKTPAPF